MTVTVTTKEQVAVFPASSVKSYLTTVVPMGKHCPGKKLFWTLGTPDTMSIAKGSLQKTFTQEVGEAVSLVMSSGQKPIRGGELSVK